MKFDSLEDFAPIHGIANTPTLLGVYEAVPIASVRELIALAKAKPGELNYASGGPGSPQHLAKSGLEIWPTTSEEMPGMIRDELARWKKVAREANIKAD